MKDNLAIHFRRCKVCLFLVIALFLSGCGPNIESPVQTDPTPDLQAYEDCVVGLLPDDQTGSYAVLYYTSDWTYEILLELPDVTPDNYAAVSNDGKYLAYTTWDDLFARRYLKLYNFESGETRSFFEDITPECEIIKISWLPDNETILYVERDTSISSYEEIKTLHVPSGEITTLVKGEVWRIRASYDGDLPPEDFYLKGAQRTLEVQYAKEDTDVETLVWGYYLSQDEINEIYHSFGGTGTYDIDLIPNLMYVEFSAPRCSPDGQKIVYTASLQRNSAMGEHTPLWIISSIFEYDIASGHSEILYTQNDGGCLGRVDWVNDDQLAFISYYDWLGSQDNIGLYHMGTQTAEVIFEYSEEHYNNVTLLPINSQEVSFTSSAQGEFYEDSETWKISIDSGSASKSEIYFDQEVVLLENFIYFRLQE